MRKADVWTSIRDLSILCAIGLVLFEAFIHFLLWVVGCLFGAQ